MNICYPKEWLNPSYIEKINAELGADRATVIPQPRYSPFNPSWCQTDFPTVQNDRFADRTEISSVCMRDLIVSAG